MIGDVCTADWLHDKLQPSSSSSTGLNDVTVGDTRHCGLLVLDCRSLDDYTACHVTGSMPVTVTSIMLRRLRNGSASVSAVVGGGDSYRTSFIERWKSDHIVLYDNTDCSHVTASSDDSSSSIMSTLLSRLRSDGCRVSCLEGGFISFRDKYSHMCINGNHQHHQLRHNPHLRLDDVFSNMRLSSSAPSSLSSLSLVISSDVDSCDGLEVSTPLSAVPSSGGLPFPVEVVPYLFLGDAETSRDLNCLRHHNIRYIVNVTESVPNSFTDDVSLTYMRIPITDHWSQSLTSFFSNAINFIDEARQSHCSVLVHCLAGISRSVTVTVAYLMYFMSVSLDDAFDYLRRIRPNIAPNFSFMGQLLDFERTLEVARSHCIAHHSKPRRPCQRCFDDVTNGHLSDLSSCRTAIMADATSSNKKEVVPNIVFTLP